MNHDEHNPDLGHLDPNGPDLNGLDPNGPDTADDVRSVRGRLAGADPAGPLAPSATAQARVRLAERLAPLAAGAAGGAASSGLDAPGRAPVLAAVGAVSAPTASVRRRPSRWLAVPVAAVVALLVGLLAFQPFAHQAPAGAAMVRAAALATEAAGTGRLSASVEGLGQSASAEGVVDLSNSDGHLTVHAPDPVGDVEVIHAGNDLWVSAPTLLGQLLGGSTGPWLHADAATLASVAPQAGAAGLSLSFALDPVKAVDYVRSVSGEVTTVGTETLRGDDVTHYSTHLDPAKLSAQLGDAAHQDAFDRAVTAVNQDVPVDLWIDGAGRLRKITISADLDKVQVPAGTDTRGVTLTGPVSASFELYDFGAALDTTAPPADQVTEVGPLLGMLRQLGGH